MSKEIIRIPVNDKHNQVETIIPVGIAKGQKPGPTLGILNGVHQSEFAAHDGAIRFWDSLEPSKMSGTVMMVLAADVMGVCAHGLYVNPVDGKNFNRVWPGKEDGTLTEVLAYSITEEVIKKADAVIDCHGGEYDEEMAPYLITHEGGDPTLDKKTLDLARALGLPYIEVTDANGPWLGVGTSTGEIVRGGRPGMALEIGGGGCRNEQHIKQVFYSLENAARHLGIHQGEIIPWSGKPVVIKEGLIIKTKEAGLVEPAVVANDWIEKGSLFAKVLDFDGSTVLEEIFAPESGIVLTMMIARGVKAEGFVGKIGTF